MIDRLPFALSPRLVATLAGVAGLQIALAHALAGSTRESLVLSLLVTFVVAVVIEPRIAFCLPLFYLLLGVPESGGVTLLDLILLLSPALVLSSWLVDGRIARRAGRFLTVHRFKVVTVVFAALVLVAVGKGFGAGNTVGVLQSVRLAIAPVLLFGLTVFRDRRELLNGLRVTFYGFAIFSFLQALAFLATGRSPTAEELSTGGTRVVAGSTAMYLVIGTILLALHLAEEDRLLRRLGLSLLMAASLFCIVLGFARTTWAAAVVVLIPLLVLAPEMRRGVSRFIGTMSPLIILSALLVPVFAADQLKTIGDRVGRPEGPTERDFSAVFREQAWGAMLDLWRESPILGTGFGQSVSFLQNDRSTIVVVNDPHNGFIYILVAMGVIGLFAFAVVQLGFIRMAIDAARRSPIGRNLGIWALAAWVIYMANVFTGVVLGSASLMMFLWILLAVPVALAALPEREEESVAEPVDEAPGRRRPAPAPA